MGLILTLACATVLACAATAAATPVFLSATNVSQAGVDAFGP